jgi:hypothetical protein
MKLTTHVCIVARSVMRGADLHSIRHHVVLGQTQGQVTFVSRLVRDVGFLRVSVVFPGQRLSVHDLGDVIWVPRGSLNDPGTHRQIERRYECCSPRRHSTELHDGLFFF